MNQDLIQKLMISKKIMEKHNTIPRSGNGASSIGNNYDTQIPTVENYEPVQASYNIPQEYLSESALPKRQTTNLETSKDAVINSKLPDEIKRLMLEHPIQKPQQPEVTISNDIVEAAARLMNIKANGDPINSNTQNRTQKQTTTEKTSVVPSNIDLKKMVKEAVKEILQENGLLTESSQKSNEVFSFRVGQHIFEGKVTKIKKIKG